MSTRWGVRNGEGGIRTPDRGISPYNGLANRRLQPLGHLSFEVRKLAIHWSMCNPQPPLREWWGELWQLAHRRREAVTVRPQNAGCYRYAPGRAELPVSLGMWRLGTALPTCGTALAAPADMTLRVQRTYSG